MKLLNHVRRHILKHQYKYLGLAVVLLGLLSVPFLQTIQHTYADGSYLITVLGSANGTIDPSKGIMASNGTDQTFTFTPDVGYGVATVTIDGDNSAGPMSSYTFTNIIADHTIDASFAELPSYSGYSIICPGITTDTTLRLNFNSNINSLSPLTNLTIGGTYYPITVTDTSSKVLIDLGTSFADGSYNLDIAADTERNTILDTEAQTIPFTVDCEQNTITITAGPNGTTEPVPGTTTLTQDSNQTIQFLPDAGYTVDTVEVNNSFISPASAYTFTKVTEPQTIEVTFKLAPSVGGGGSPSTDNCWIGSNLPGANTGGLDYSNSRYDGTCLSPEEIACADLSCLDLPGKAAELKTLSDSLTDGLQSLGILPATTANVSLIKLFQNMATQLSSVNK